MWTNPSVVERQTAHRRQSMQIAHAKAQAQAQVKAQAPGQRTPQTQTPLVTVTKPTPTTAVAPKNVVKSSTQKGQPPTTPKAKTTMPAAAVTQGMPPDNESQLTAEMKSAREAQTEIQQMQTRIEEELVDTDAALTLTLTVRFEQTTHVLC